MSCCRRSPPAHCRTSLPAAPPSENRSSASPTSRIPAMDGPPPRRATEFWKLLHRRRRRSDDRVPHPSRTLRWVGFSEPHKEKKMSAYSIPQIEAPIAAVPGEVLLIASGDLRQSANQVCWPAQSEAERAVIKAFAAEGLKFRRAHPYREDLKHGFIFNQRMGMDVFAAIDPASPLVVVESVWQYSHHVLAGLLSHRGPILTVANWSGQWPGLVGMLNLNGCLRKAGVKFSTIWTKDFDDPFFLNGLRQWIREGRIDHDLSHVH